VDAGVGSFVQFLSWPDFLLGFDAVANGTGTFSNVFASIDESGLFNRQYRVWEGSAFAQDNYRIGNTLTLNLGLRYERLGRFADSLGRNSSFDIRKADPNPPSGGSVAGFVVASNFPGVVPPGVLRTDNQFANDGAGQNTLAPRIGFRWQGLPGSSRLVFRGGYGMYCSRPTDQAFFQNTTTAPFSLLRSNSGTVNADGIGTAFANSATGIADGPGRANLDLALSKVVSSTGRMRGPALNFVLSCTTRSTIHNLRIPTATAPRRPSVSSAARL
jgi:hypothetical protein